VCALAFNDAYRLAGKKSREKAVAVGTALAGGPPHGSVLEELPHTALSSGRTRVLPKAAGRGPPVKATRRVRLSVRGVVNGKDRPLARSPSLGGLRRRLEADVVRPLRRCRVGGGALGCPHAGLRPPLKRSVQFSRTPLSQRHATSVGGSKELVRSSVQGPTRRRDDVPEAVSSPDTATA
jgi:hypothetical protein